jgi:CheY-like chemotaxis protein
MAAGLDVVSVTGPSELREDGEVFIFVNPGSPEIDTIREMRARLPDRIPLVAAGGEAPEFFESWMEAGAADILPDGMETAELEARLRRAVWWHRHAAREKARVCGEWKQRVELSRRTQRSVAFGLAHDFNNLLSVIQGNVDLSLMNPSLSGEIRYNLSQISQAAQSAAGLAIQVLDLSRAERQPAAGVKLNEALRALRGMIRDASGGRAVEFRFDEQIPAVRAKLGALAEGLALLVSSMAGRGESRGSVKLATQAGQGGRVELEIRCDRVSGADRRPVEGGMLNLCRELLEESGAVLSLPERGTAQLEFEAGAADSPAAVAGNGPGNRATATVLLVDDEEGVRDAVHKLLRQDGYTVLEAGSGEEGLELFRTIGGMLDAVILDLNMPGMEGGEVLHQMRNLRPEVRVVVWSGYSEDVARQQMNGFTDVAFIEKPVQLTDFPRMLREVLEER